VKRASEAIDFYRHAFGTDADARTDRAVRAGATIMRPLQDQFYGDRTATLKDSFGHIWTLATHMEDHSPVEIGRRMKEMKRTAPEGSS